MALSLFRRVMPMSEPTITFDESASDFIAEAFGWELTNYGYLWDGDVVVSISGHPVHIDEFAGVVEYEGELRPIRDDFNELVDYVKYRHESSNGGKDE